MQDPVVTYKQAAQLKELGFDQKVTYFYDILDETLYQCFVQKRTPDNFNRKETLLSAPTVSLALDWIRAELNLYCGIYPCVKSGSLSIGYHWRYYTLHGEDGSTPVESNPLNPFEAYALAESELLSFVLEYLEDYKIRKK